MRKSILLATTSGRRGWTLSEIRLGRMLRNPEGEHSQASGDQGAANTGGNSGGESNGGRTENNDGQAPDLTSFWNPEGEDGKSPNSGSADGSDSPSNPPVNLAETLGAQLNGMNFGELMSPEILESFSNGDVKGFNTGIQEFGKNVAKQTLGMTVGIMRHLRDEMMAEVDSRMSGEMNSRENYAALESAIPSAKDPVAGTTIKGIYAQALKRSKGNKEVAIQQTKDVMKLQAEMFGGDLGLSVAAKNSGDSHYTPPKATNWLEELAGR